jgi:DNA polymerase delta subunit 1
VLENNIPLDTEYYLEHSLAKPIERVFRAVMDDPLSLVRGEHTRQRTQQLPPKSAALMKFVKVTMRCLACGSNLPPDCSDAVCKTCADKAPDVYSNLLAKRNHYESIYSKVWTQCQQCQGSLHLDVLCTSRDCPVFYMRKKVQKDLDDMQAMIDRFGLVGSHAVRVIFVPASKFNARGNRAHLHLRSSIAAMCPESYAALCT